MKWGQPEESYILNIWPMANSWVQLVVWSAICLNAPMSITKSSLQIGYKSGALLLSTQGHSQTPSNPQYSLQSGLRQQHFCLQGLLQKANATKSHINATSGLICIYWFMSLETSVLSYQGESKQYATALNYINSMSSFYRLLHKPVGTAVREGAQENIRDCKPMKANGSYILYI